MSMSHVNIFVLRILKYHFHFLESLRYLLCASCCLVLGTAFTPQAAGLSYPLVSPTSASVNLGLINSAASLYQTLAQPSVDVYNHAVRNI